MWLTIGEIYFRVKNPWDLWFFYMAQNYAAMLISRDDRVNCVLVVTRGVNVIPA